MEFHNDDRAVSSTIGVILMAALTVMFAAAVGVFVFDVDDKLQGGTAPQAEFDFTYNDDGTLTVTHRSGQDIESKYVDIVGGDAWGDQFTTADHGDVVTTGEQATIGGAEAGETIKVVYEPAGGGKTFVLEEYTTRNSIPLALSFDATTPPDGSAVTAFQQDFEQQSDTNVMYDEKTDYIRWAEDTGGGNGVMEYYSPVEGEQTSVTIDVKFEADSYEGSGAHLYAVDESGDKYTVFCDGSGYISTCGDRGSNWMADKTVTINADEDITAVYLVTDLSNVEGKWWDEARLYHITVEE